MNIQQRNANFLGFVTKMKNNQEETANNIYMTGLARTARHVNTDACNLAYYVENVVYKLPFSTDADAELKRAEAALESALARVRAAQERFSNKPVKLPVRDWSEDARMLSLDAAE